MIICQCPACGSWECKNEEVHRVYLTKSGDEINYTLTIQRCLECTEAGDFLGVNSAIVKQMIDAVEKCTKDTK